jgi:hypothetical protein
LARRAANQRVQSSATASEEASFIDMRVSRSLECGLASPIRRSSGVPALGQRVTNFGSEDRSTSAR